VNPLHTDTHANPRTMAGVRHLPDQIRHATEKALKNTHAVANNTLNRTEDKINQFHNRVDPVVENLASQAQKLVRQSLDMAYEASAQAQRSVGRTPTLPPAMWPKNPSRPF
jgi:hypothetical protein